MFLVYVNEAFGTAFLMLAFNWGEGSLYVPYMYFLVLLLFGTEEGGHFNGAITVGFYLA